MNSLDWAEITGDYDATFRPKTAAERNLVAGIADLRAKSTLTPAVKTAAYTLTEADHGQVIYLESGTGELAIPAGLPVWFRCSVRNLHTSARLIAPLTGATMNAYPRGGAPSMSAVEINLDTCGACELAFSALNVAELHGDLTAT